MLLGGAFAPRGETVIGCSVSRHAQHLPDSSALLLSSFRVSIPLMSSYRNANTIPRTSKKIRVISCVCARVCVCVKVIHLRESWFVGEGDQCCFRCVRAGGPANERKCEASQKRSSRSTDETQGCFLYRMYFGSGCEC